MEKKLYRDELHKKVGGVCAGLAEYFNVDVSIVRILFVVSFVMKGVGVPLYVILWIVLPKKPLHFYNPEVDYRVPPQNSANPFNNGPQPNFTMPNFNQPNGPFKGKGFKSNTNMSALAGGLLIVIGTGFLLNQFNLIPDIDFDVIWPLALVGAGAVFIFSGSKNKPWQTDNWEKEKPEFDTTAPSADEPQAPAADDTTTTPTNDDKPVNE